MDVDDFKTINDSYGHAVGDRVLATVATVIKKEMRQMDILARYAGDEFVAIMPMASSTMATMIAERVRAAVESQKYPVRTGKTVEIGISLGVSCFPNDGETTEELFTDAARKMQHNKHARKLVPETIAVLIAEVAPPPGATDSDVGLAEIETSFLVAEIMVSETVAVWLPLAAVPVTVKMPPPITAPGPRGGTQADAP